MEKSVKKVILTISAGLLLLLALIIINQLYQIFMITSALNPILGKIVTTLLGVIFTVMLFLPIIGFARLQKPLEIPDESDQSAYLSYLMLLKKRLEKNKNLISSGYRFDDTKDLKNQIEEALELLDREALKAMNEASSTVFITTSVSQNGALDSFFVLFSISKLIWKISHIYNQKPNIKEIFYLYANVAVTVFMARELEDLDFLDDEIEPIIDSLIGGTLSAFVPGASAVASIVINSLIQGTANAFLALRVGAITKRYSRALTKADRRTIKRSATIESVSLLRKIVQQNSVSIVKAFAAASKKATIDRTIDKIKTGASKTGDFVKDIFSGNKESDQV